MTHGKTIEAKTVMMHCNECGCMQECYDFGNMKVCCECLMRVNGKTEKVSKKPMRVEPTECAVKSEEMQGVLF
jgi:DNA-binding sugar fermentation-stimulating protein